MKINLVLTLFLICHYAQCQISVDSLLKKYPRLPIISLRDTCYSHVFSNDNVSFSLEKQSGNVYTNSDSIVSLKVIIKNNDTKNIFIDKHFEYSLGNKSTTWRVNILYKDSLKMLDSNTESFTLYGLQTRGGFVKLKPNETTEFIFTIDFSKLDLLFFDYQLVINL